MAQQKLYTEEQVKDILNGFIDERFVSDFLHRYYTPIELPSDEEIRKESHNYFIRGQLGFEAASDTERAFLRGVLWLKDKIQGGNK